MSRQFEKRGKKVQKMTRDGLVEQNLDTGEEIRISQRGQDFNLRQEQPPDGGGEIGPPSGAGRFHHQPQAAQTGTAQELEWQPEIRRDIPLRPEAARDDTGTGTGRRNNTAYQRSYNENGHTASPIPDSWQAADSRAGVSAGAPPSAADAEESAEQETEAAEYPERLRSTEGAEHTAPSGVPRPDSSRQHGTGYSKRFDLSAAEQPDAAEQHGKLQFAKDAEHPTPSGVPRQADSSRQHSTGYSRKFDPSALEQPDAAEQHSRLQFTRDAERPEPSSVPRQTDSSRPDSSRQHSTEYSRRFGPEARTSRTDEVKQENVPKPAATGTATEAEPAKPSRLQFAHGESAPAVSPAPDKKLNRLQDRADAVNAKLEQAREKLPAKNKMKRKRVYDEQKGKARRSFQFERETLAPGQKRLTSPAALTDPAAIGKYGARLTTQNAHQEFHKKIYEVENENVGIAAAHRAELAAEGIARAGVRSVRAVYRFHKNAPYRTVEKLEKQVGRLNSKLSFHKAAGAKGGALSRAAQKRNIKKRYGSAYRAAQNTAKQAGKAAKRAGEAIVKSLKSVVTFAVSHPAAVGIIGGILLVVFFFFTMLSSCANMAAGGLSSAVIGSYTAPDADIENAGLSYTEWETDLREQIENAETDHSGYDEYRYDVDMDAIGHDPYALMAYLSAKYQDFQYSDIEADLQDIFAEQYSLTFTPEVEIRYNDPGDEDDDGDTEPYEWHILNIKLEVKPFADVLAGRMDDAETELYGVYMENRGNRQYLINPFAFDWEPYISCLYGWRIHPITGARDFHTGLDIAVPLGTPILAGQDGTVTFAGDNGDYGLMVHIDGEDGLSSRYAHCSELLVTAGQEVNKGDVIAKVGSTGASTGPHLHLEVIKDGQRLNPVYFAESK